MVDTVNWQGIADFLGVTLDEVKKHPLAGFVKPLTIDAGFEAWYAYMRETNSFEDRVTKQQANALWPHVSDDVKRLWRNVAGEVLIRALDHHPCWNCGLFPCECEI